MQINYRITAESDTSYVTVEYLTSAGIVINKKPDGVT